jgi:ligand-binding SRPBCC domain-containing protein
MPYLTKQLPTRHFWAIVIIESTNSDSLQFETLMPLITLATFINSSPEIVFDLSRSIEVHQESTAVTQEKAIAGRTSGLCEEGDLVTWEAIHLGVKQRLTVRISKMHRPFSFDDEMVRGAFKRMRHMHTFEPFDGGTIMSDHFEYQSPLGVLGKFADLLVLKKYMTNLLHERNRVIKEKAEKLHHSYSG